MANIEDLQARIAELRQRVGLRLHLNQRYPDQRYRKRLSLRGKSHSRNPALRDSKPRNLHLPHPLQPPRNNGNTLSGIHLGLRIVR